MATSKKPNNTKSGGRSSGHQPKGNSRGGERRGRPDLEDSAPELTYKSLDSAAMAAVFSAAVGLYRARPWQWVPLEETLFSITSEPLGLQDAALLLMGQEGDGAGFMLFSSGDDLDAYLDAVEKLEREEQARAPRHIALTFEHRSQIEPALRKEIDAKGWEVRASAAVPLLVAVDEKLVIQPPTAQDVAVAEAVLLALPEFLANEADFVAAWKDNGVVERTLSIRARNGQLKVDLRSPYDTESDGDLLDALQALEADEEIDHEERQELEDELISHFLESPEARDLEEARFYRPVFDLAASHHGATVATLQRDELREILFELFPRKVLVPPSEAGAVIDELRALVRYLERAFGWERAGACLELLGPSAVAELEAALQPRRD